MIKRLLPLAFVMLMPSVASAAPTLRKTFDVRGDAISIGSTLGFDCGAGVAAPAGTTAVCGGLGESDTSPDNYWRDDFAGMATASTAARTSMNLNIPAGAKVEYARLYWSALAPGSLLDDPDADLSVILDRPGASGFSNVVVADSSKKLPVSGGGLIIKQGVYQSSADVTTIVTTRGSGIYRVSDVQGLVFDSAASESAYSAWTLVVVYSLAGDTYRHIQLFDGIDAIKGGTPETFTSNGFRLSAVKGAKLTIFAYEGDASLTGDDVTFAGTSLFSGTPKNFFDSSRTILGVPVAGVSPPLSGAKATLAGYDLHTVDVSSLLSTGDTSATVQASATAGGDEYWLGGGIISIDSAAPKITAIKTFVDLNGGKPIPGDVLEFTIAVKNEGEDEATEVVVSDPLPAGLTYQAGSLKIGGVSKTDPATDDQGEVLGSTITARVGTGADATKGGSLAIGASVNVTFRVTITGAPGGVLNQGKVSASGKLGAPKADTPTDGDPTTPGDQGTIVPVKECDSISGGCTGGAVCDPVTNTCGGGDAGGDGASGDGGLGDGASGDGGLGDGSSGDGSSGDGSSGDGSSGDGSSGDGSSGDGDLDGASGDGDIDGATEDSGAGDDSGADLDGALADGGDLDGGDSLDGAVAEGGGCGCALPGSTNRAPHVALLLVAGAMILARRRRRG